MELIEREQHGNLIDTVLINRGVKDIETFKHIEKADIKLTDPKDIDRMTEGVELLKKHIEKGNKIGILIDGDADGFTSSAIIYHELKIEGIGEDKVDVVLLSSNQKSHGLHGMEEEIINSGIDLLIVPDAGSNDYDSQNMLIHEYDIDIIIIDHHDIEDKEEAKHADAVIINSQLNDMNHNYTGAGMTTLFARAFRDGVADGLDFTLAAIGEVADVGDVSDLEIRYLQYCGLDFMYSLLLDEYIENDRDHISSHMLSFGIIPQLNAVARIGNKEERINIVRALANDFDKYKTVSVDKRRKNKKTGRFEVRSEDWSQYQLCAADMLKAKTKQTKLVNEAISNGEHLLIKTPTLYIMVLKDEKYRPITGLIANKISGDNNVAAMVLIEDDDLSGSGRGCEKYYEDFKQELLDSKLVEFAQGHANAFGVEIEKENLDPLIEMFNNSDIKPIPDEVDKIYNMNTISKKEIESVVDNQCLFGGKVSEPILGFKDMEVPKNGIRRRGKVLTFSTGGINFIAYDGNKYNFKPNFGNTETVNIKGQVTKSSWGNVTQIVIRDMEQIEKKNNVKTGELVF